MRNLILVAVILQLAIIIIGINGKYEFGDIISFKRKYKDTALTFKHFAVYVGTAEFEGKTAEQDIFHRLGFDDNVPNPDCVFGVLANEAGEQQVENYLDGAKVFTQVKLITKGTDQEISNRIKAMHTAAGCGKYNVRFNNCEHLATYVRYDASVTKQRGTDAGKVCLADFPVKCYKLDALVRRMEANARAEQGLA